MKLISHIKQEGVRLICIFLFFLVFFTLINWIESFLFEKVGITPFRFLEVAIAAALITKIVLVADYIPIVHRFRSKPLIYGIVWKTVFYWTLLLGVRLVIVFVPFLYESSGDFKVADDLFIQIVNWNLFISIQAYYLMLLFIFVTFQELAFKIGPSKMRRLFFGF